MELSYTVYYPFTSLTSLSFYKLSKEIGFETN